MAWQAKSAVLVPVLLCGLSSTSHAVNLNNDGTGQVLLYPYYTVQNGNQTLISIMNASTLGKAVKVRVLEGRNGRTALSFNLYLAPEDIWTGAIFDTDNTGPGALISLDRSCTVPELSQSAERINGLPFTSFTNANYTGTLSDGGPASPERTREGFVEVFEMGTIAVESELENLIHHTNGEPAGCGEIARRWANYAGSGPEPFNSSIAIASGGLIGTGAVVDVVNGSHIDYSAQALDGFYRRSMHTDPNSGLPALSSADPQSIVLQDGEAIRSTWSSSGIDAVSSVLMAEELRNEFAIELALDGKSEWVISMPTKAFYTDPYRSGSIAALPPFSVDSNKGASCEFEQFYFRDRESQTGAAEAQFPVQPPQGPPTLFCFGVNVLAIGQLVLLNSDQLSSPTRLFGSQLGRTLIPKPSMPFNRAGWLKIVFTTDSRGRIRQLPTSIEGHRFIGLPVLGFAAIQLENRQAAPGVRAVYGGAYVHKRKIACSKTLNGQNGDCFEPN